MLQSNTKKRIIRRAEVERRTGKSRSTIYAEMAEGKFPKNFPISGRAVGWDEDEIDAHIAACIARRDEPKAA
jgi:prophage regulatory protein